jgi:hypothetical protein
MLQTGVAPYVAASMNPEAAASNTAEGVQTIRTYESM